VLGLFPSGRTLRRRSWIGVTRVQFSGAASRRHRSHRPLQVARAVLLAIVTLAGPVLVAANPVDPTWQPGLYDDADTDQLVVQTLSPEGMIGVAALMLVCLLLYSTPIEPSVPCRQRVSGEEADARGPPGPSIKSTNQSMAPCFNRARVALLVFHPSPPLQAFRSLPRQPTILFLLPAEFCSTGLP